MAGGGGYVQRSAVCVRNSWCVGSMAAGGVPFRDQLIRRELGQRPAGLAGEKLKELGGLDRALIAGGGRVVADNDGVERGLMLAAGVADNLRQLRSIGYGRTRVRQETVVRQQEQYIRLVR